MLTLLTISLFLLCVSTGHTAQQKQADETGQTKANRLRDAASLSDLPNATARHAAARIDRVLTQPWHIWQNVDAFTKQLLAEPELLDLYVVAVDSTIKEYDTVTLYAGFSCLDLGKSSGKPIYFWAAPDLSPLSELCDAPGCAQEGKTGEASTTDILQQCWRGRTANPDLRVVEHNGFHRGEGARLVSKSFTDLKSPVGNNSVFSSFLEERKAEHSHNEVIYHSAYDVALVYNLPFATGFRMHVPKNHSETLGRELRVPLTPLLSMRQLFGFRLEQAQLAPEDPRTSSLVVIVSLLSVVLALIVATWVAVKIFTDDVRRRALALQKKGVDKVVRESMPCERSQITFLFLQLLGVVVLIAPLVLAILVGDADPRPQVEVTTGMTIMYGPQRDTLSHDRGNAYAGAPWHTCVYLSVRMVDDGHHAAFFLTLAFVWFMLWMVYVLHSKRSSELIPPTHRPVYFWSLPGKILGMIHLRLKCLWNPENKKIYRVLVQFRDSVEGMAAEMKMLLLGVGEFRKMANLSKRERDDGALNIARKEIAAHFCHTGKRRKYGLLGRVVVNNSARFSAMLSGTRYWWEVMPRNWYRLTSFEGRDAKTIEYYRTNGDFLPDRYVVAARLGLVPYLEHVRRIVLVEEDSNAMYDIDNDGVNVGVLVSHVDGEDSMGEEHESIEVEDLRDSEGEQTSLLGGSLLWDSCNGSVADFICDEVSVPLPGGSFGFVHYAVHVQV